MLTVGLDAAQVEADLRAGLLACPAAGCAAVLGPWGSARERLVRGVGRLLPRRGRCRGCGRTQVLLPASVLRADAVTVIGAGACSGRGESIVWPTSVHPAGAPAATEAVHVVTLQ